MVVGFGGTTDMTERLFVHPQGICESSDVGDRTRVWAFAHVLEGARVGADCNICDGAYVEGGATVGDRVTIKNQVMLFDGVHIADDVFLGPGVTFTNDLRPRAHIKLHAEQLLPTFVQAGATLGARVTVVCGLTIGAHAFVGAGTVVTQDVPPHGFVVGNPGQVRGWVCVCAERLDADLRCRCGRAYRLVDGVIRSLTPLAVNRKASEGEPTCLDHGGSTGSTGMPEPAAQFSEAQAGNVRG